MERIILTIRVPEYVAAVRVVNSYDPDEPVCLYYDPKQLRAVDIKVIADKKKAKNG